MPCYDHPPFNYVHERASSGGNKIGAVAGHKLGGELPPRRLIRLICQFLADVFRKNSGAVAGHKLGEKLPPRRLIESHQQMVYGCQL